MNNEPGAYIIDATGQIQPDLSDEAMAARQKPLAESDPPKEITNAKK